MEPTQDPRFSQPTAAPVTTPLARPGVQMSKRTTIISGIVGLFILCGMCSCVGNVVRSFSPSSPSSPSSSANVVVDKVSHVATATATTIPTPTATVDVQIAEAAVYSQMVSTDASTLGTDFGAVSNTCGTGDVAACRDAVQTTHDDLITFQNDINSATVPPCLSTANSEISKALKLYIQGTQDILDGIDNFDPDLMNTGSSIVKSADPYMQKATAATKAAVC